MKTHTKALLTALACTTLAVGTTQAATIASFDFATNTSSASLANTTVSDFSATGTAFEGSGRSSGSQNFFTRSGESSFTGTNYVGFTVDIAAGYELDLSSLTFNYKAQSGNGSSLGDSTYSVRTSVDFGSDLAGTYSVNPDTADAGDTATETATFNLSGASFQNLTGTFEVRIYGILDQSTLQFINRYDNVVLSGEVVEVPEPGSLALLGLGGLLIGARRRRGA